MSSAAIREGFSTTVPGIIVSTIRTSWMVNKSHAGFDYYEHDTPKFGTPEAQSSLHRSHNFRDLEDPEHDDRHQGMH